MNRKEPCPKCYESPLGEKRLPTIYGSKHCAKCDRCLSWISSCPVGKEWYCGTGGCGWNPYTKTYTNGKEPKEEKKKGDDWDLGTPQKTCDLNKKDDDDCESCQ